MNVFSLSFKDKSIPELSGFEYGLETYKDQVGVKDFSEPITIVFPDYIEGIAISFVQGFISEVLMKISKSKLQEVLKIQSIHEEVVEEFYDNATY